MNHCLLSILIPTTADRCDFFADVMTELSRQVRLLSEWYGEDYWRYVEILKDPRPAAASGGPSIGKKRNDLLQAATGEWVAFVDSDDMVSRDYLKVLLSNINTIRGHINCFSLRGIMTTNGENPEVFEHSIKYQAWRTNDGATGESVKYERFINHLNCIRANVAKQFAFPETNFAEDHAYSKLLQASGLFEGEGTIDSILYYYKYRSGK